jgi:hypothetical protein
VHYGGFKCSLRRAHGALWRVQGCIKEGSWCIMESLGVHYGGFRVHYGGFRNALKSVQGALWRVWGCIEGSGCIVEGLGVH